MGSPAFAVPALQALLAAGHDIAMVYTQPARPAGRGGKPKMSRVAEDATARGLPLATPARLKGNQAEWARFAALDLDAAVVAAYGQILPPALLNAPRRGCLNIHASLLPRWRGAAPVAAAILAGDAVSGITVMQMDEGLDTGPILLHEELVIPAHATAGSLTATLADVGARLIVSALTNNPPGRPQPDDGATYAPRLSRADGKLDWSLSAARLERQVRAFDPWPGSFFDSGNVRLKVLRAEVVRESGAAGILLDARFTVACGEDALRLIEVQPAGRPRMEGAAFLRGQRLAVGNRLG